MKSVFASWRLFLCLGLVFLLPCDRVAGQDNDHFAWTQIANAHFFIMSPPPTRRYVRQIRDGAGTLFTCYLFANDENIGRSDMRHEKTGLGMLAGRGHYKFALYRKGWNSPQVQAIELFGPLLEPTPSDGNGTIYLSPPLYSDFPLLNSVFILHGPGSGQPDIVVVQEDLGNKSSLSLTNKRFLFIQNDKLVPILCKVPGRPASVGDYGSNSLNGEDEKYIPLHVEPFGPFRFKSSFNNVGASVINLDVKDKRIGEFEDTWLFSPDQHLLIRESRRKKPKMHFTATPVPGVPKAKEIANQLIRLIKSRDWTGISNLCYSDNKEGVLLAYKDIRKKIAYVRIKTKDAMVQGDRVTLWLTTSDQEFDCSIDVKKGKIIRLEAECPD